MNAKLTLALAAMVTLIVADFADAQVSGSSRSRSRFGTQSPSNRGSRGNSRPNVGGSSRPGFGSSRSGSNRSRFKSNVPKIKIPKIKRPKIKVPDLRSKSPFSGGSSGSMFKEVKKCSGCSKVVPDSSRSGQRCPHCNILWTYESGKFGTKTSGSSSRRSSSRSSSPTRRVTPSRSSRSSSSSSFTDRLNQSSQRVDDAVSSARSRANTSYYTRLTIKIITLCIFAGAAITGFAMRFN